MSAGAMTFTPYQVIHKDSNETAELSLSVGFIKPSVSMLFTNETLAASILLRQDAIVGTDDLKCWSRTMCLHTAWGIFESSQSTSV